MSQLFKALDWVHHTNIYEVNLRQYSWEGSFKAFAKHLPRLQRMGVEVLWFMPITPIGIPKRLGTLGSYYACSSYVRTNEEFGSIDDFRKLVKDAHKQGFKVIIDWVANHTGYGHDWMESNPEYYLHDEAGNFVELNGWTDVADLDYSHEPMRLAMIDAMRFWVNECDIDGFRCDMAHLVPLDFWHQARTVLDKVKPLLWLAECEVPEYHLVFEISYAWGWMHISESFAQSRQTISVLDKVLYGYQFDYPEGAMKLFFTSNHDENSWNGTEYEKYGAMASLFAIFSFTWNGIPLIYSGQEIPNTRRLKFFDKDPIEWVRRPALEDFYKRLLALRKSNKALLAADPFARTIRLSMSNERVMAYLRTYGSQEVLVLLNFNAEACGFYINDARVNGTFSNVFTEESIDMAYTRHIVLDGYGYLVLEKA